MNKKRKLLMAFIAAAAMMVFFVVVGLISGLLDYLPRPWNFIANGAIFLAFATYGIYGLISAFQSDKEIHDPDCRCREKGGGE